MQWSGNHSTERVNQASGQAQIRQRRDWIQGQPEKRRQHAASSGHKKTGQRPVFCLQRPGSGGHALGLGGDMPCPQAGDPLHAFGGKARL